MPYYLVNKQAQSTGEHEVHKYSCDHLPDLKNREPLGHFMSSKEAIQEAKKIFPKVDGCHFCCDEADKR